MQKLETWESIACSKKHNYCSTVKTDEANGNESGIHKADKEFYCILYIEI